MDNIPPLHQIKTPEGYEGWQWMNGPIFLYNKDDSDDSTDAQILAMEWGGVAMRVQRLQLEVQRRIDRAREANPIILSIEEARNDSGRIPQTDG